MNIIPTAFAADTATLAASTPSLTSFIPLVLVFAVFYFMMMRPQMKKQKEHRALIDSLKRGEKVITNSGILGTIVKVEDDAGIFHLEIAPNVKIRILKSAIAEVMNNSNIKTDASEAIKVENTKEKEETKEQVIEKV